MALPNLTDKTAWPDPDLEALRIAVLTEQERRANLATIPAQVADLTRAYTAGGGVKTTLTEAVTTA